MCFRFFNRFFEETRNLTNSDPIYSVKVSLSLPVNIRIQLANLQFTLFARILLKWRFSLSEARIDIVDCFSHDKPDFLTLRLLIVNGF